MSDRPPVDAAALAPADPALFVDPFRVAYLLPWERMDITASHRRRLLWMGGATVYYDIPDDDAPPFASPEAARAAVDATIAAEVEALRLRLVTLRAMPPSLARRGWTPLG